MKKVLLEASIIESFTKQEYISFFMLMRMLSVLNRKEHALYNQIKEQKIIISDIIDIYCDLLSTYTEAAKEYFKKHLNILNNYLKIRNTKYENKMEAIFESKLEEAKYPYNILNQFRNIMSFHFKSDFIEKYFREGERLSLIGFQKDDGNIILSNTLPFLLDYLADILKVKTTVEDISKVFKELNNNHVVVFMKYLDRKYYAIAKEKYIIEES
ncbi:MAG: hypothetical protein ACYDEX_25805 [Mobilitalea sp.]